MTVSNKNIYNAHLLGLIEFMLFVRCSTCQGITLSFFATLSGTRFDLWNSRCSSRKLSKIQISLSVCRRLSYGILCMPSNVRRHQFVTACIEEYLFRILFGG